MFIISIIIDRFVFERASLIPLLCNFALNNFAHEEMNFLSYVSASLQLKIVLRFVCDV